MFKLLKKLWRDRRGNALMIAAAALPLVVGSAGLATDTIQWVLWKRQLQRAADSAAIAGVYARIQGQAVNAAVTTDLNNTHTNAAAIAEANGTPTITQPTITNATNAVRVDLAVQRPLGFSGMFMSTAPIVRASATAATVSTGQYCVVSLENTGATGITATGNSDINLGCGMITNSTSLNAAIATGSSSVHATPVAAVGDIQDNSHWNGAELLPFTVAETDPFGTVPAPTSFPASCPSYWAHTGAQPPPVAGTDYVVTTQGYYCMSDLRIQGTVTLPNGVYVIDRGNLSIGAQANVTCAQCTFILTDHSSGTSGIQIGNVDINGGAELHFGPSTAGDYNNILMYQDRRAAPGTGAQINGNSASVLKGALYFPSTTLDINGDSALHFTCGKFVARTVNFSGNGSINNSCTPGTDPNPIMGAHVRLVA